MLLAPESQITGWHLSLPATVLVLMGLVKAALRAAPISCRWKGISALQRLALVDREERTQSCEAVRP